ncbi:hypothetical protein GCM10009578_038480 [Streptomyces rhizosphaericus]
MALTDHNDVFFGSTDDAWTFALLNASVLAGPRILTSVGFSAREHLGRTVYLLAPGTPVPKHGSCHPRAHRPASARERGTVVITGKEKESRVGRRDQLRPQVSWQRGFFVHISYLQLIPT